MIQAGTDPGEVDPLSWSHCPSATATFPQHVLSRKNEEHVCLHTNLLFLPELCMPAGRQPNSPTLNFDL